MFRMSHIIVYTRARGRLGGFHGVVVELQIGMGGVGQYLVVAAVDIDVHHGLFFCHFHCFFYGRTTWGAVDVRSKGLWTYVQRVLGCTSIEPMNELERG